MAIQKRKIAGYRVTDPGSIDAIQYNEKSGARKSIDVGAKLIPIPKGAAPANAVTDVSGTAVPLPAAGKNLAIYNNDTVVHNITFGSDSSVTAQAIGAVDANGNAGIPCVPARWTYLAAGESTYVISDSNKLIVFLIDDDTSISQEASR